MSVHPIDALPDGARLWIFAASRPLTAEELAFLHDRFPAFLAEWTAHGRELRAAWQILEDRFVVVAVDESPSGASGCSIDALMRHVRGLEEALGVDLLDGTPVWYRAADGEIATVGRPEFRRLAAEGVIDGKTPVFDPTVSTVGDLRAGQLERPAAESWHARLLLAGASSPPDPADR